MAAPMKIHIQLFIFVCIFITGCSLIEEIDPSKLEQEVRDTGQDHPENVNSEEPLQEDVIEETQKQDSNEIDKPMKSSKDKSERRLPWDASLSYDSNGRLVIQQIGGNITTPTNVTDKTPKKIVCKGKNLTEANFTAEVQIINSTELIKRLSSRNSSDSNCVVVMFYAPFCMFSAQTAAHYNALGRVYPQLDVLAIDAFKYSGLNAKFGTVAVPNILLFHNAKAVARFNGTERTLEYLVSFVKNVTGLAPNVTVNVTEQDFSGPLSSVPEPHVDYLLIVSWIFTLTVAFIMFARSSVGLRVWRTIASLGQEHQHIE